MASEDLTPTNGNADEASNRTFLIAVGVMGLLLVVGIIVIVAALSNRNGRTPALDQQALDATATAEAVAQITPTETEEPTATSEPTPTLEPTDTPTPAPATEEPTVTATAATIEGVTPGGTSSAAQTTPGAVASVPPAARTATAAAQGVVPAAQQTPAASGTPAAGTGSGQIPDTGIGDVAGLALAGGLIALLFVARRLRTAQT